MLAYTDPAKTLKPAKALAHYREFLHQEYRTHAKLSKSAFTLLEAFADVTAPKKRLDTVDWIAFPKTAQVSNDEIDADRFRLQDEYVEWRVEKTPAGKTKAITITTEFLEYYQAIAMVGLAELTTAIKAVIPGANPTAKELFGPGFNPATAQPEARGRVFRRFATENPWNNGRKGILCLAQPVNTLGALFGLVGPAAVPNPSVSSGDICGTLGGNCVPERNSDPSIAAAVQALARSARGLSLADPVGIEIARLGGIWRVGTTVIDINDPAANNGIWTISRRGRRATLRVVPNLTLDDDPIRSGAQVASVLKVQAAVISAAEADMPDWSRVGQETSQRLAEAAGGVP